MTWNINNSTPSTSSQEQEAAFSLTSYLATIQSELVKLNSTQEMSSSPDSETVSFQTSQSGMTSAPLTESPGEEQLTFSLEDFPAKTSVRRVKAQELAESVQAYGKNMRDSLKRCGLDLSLPKTHQTLGLEGLSPSSKTLPAWGIMLDGACWALGTLKHHTSVSECGFLPTPTVSDSKGGCKRLKEPHRQFKTTLAHYLHGLVGGEWGSSVPHPSFSEAVMMFPPAWTDLKPLEMHKFLEWQQAHSTFSHED